MQANNPLCWLPGVEETNALKAFYFPKAYLNVNLNKKQCNVVL